MPKAPLLINTVRRVPMQLSMSSLHWH